LYSGVRGDTLASALLANGVRTVSRSFKFHRPRGIYTAGFEEPNALVQLGEGARTVPAARATVTDILPGLAARSLSGLPGVNFDLGRVLDFMKPLWAAGFYNKTFIWPGWHSYEGLIRRMAGLGAAPLARDPDRYETEHLHCDVLVVGAGRSGIEAALAAASSGARVILVEQDRAVGGSGLREGASNPSPDAVLPELGSGDAAQALRSVPGLRLLLRTTATGIHDDRVVSLFTRHEEPTASMPRETFSVVRAQWVVLATGSIEQPLIFDNNDRPGIMLAGAAREYLNRYGVAAGHRVLIATNNDSAYALATDLKRAGVEVVAFADSRHEIAADLSAGVRALGILHFPGTLPINSSGFSALKGVTLGRMSPDGLGVTSRSEIPCDALAVSGGFNPALQLYAQAGGKLEFDEDSGALLPSQPVKGVEIVGRASRAVPVGQRVSPVGNPQHQWVDLLHDVTVSDLKLALRENFTAIEHVKRYTTVGMAADQGKTSAPASLEIVARLRNIATRQLGHTTLRPPVTPVTLGAIAGREIGPLFSPYRHLPMHTWHQEHGALMQDFGEWSRPVVYMRRGETRLQAFRREALTVRKSVGLFDGSSLGKIEIHGPDALAFIDRFYINDLTTLKPNRVRYGLMLRESGVLFDDGTAVMTAPDRVLLTTTSGNAGRVLQWLEEWHQCDWPDLRVAIVPVTDCWATLSLAGPLARQVLAKLQGNIDFSKEAFPHLAMREGTLLSTPARVYRVSFSGELTYEINVPADLGPDLWEALLEAGKTEGIQPFGLDALMQLRLEKGFLHVGADTDGTTIPDDVGFGKVAANKKRDYIGARSLKLPEHTRPDRLQLVGLSGSDKPFIIGSHLRVKDSREATDGWITSAGISVHEDKPVALALVRGGRGRLGQNARLFDAGACVGEAQIVAPLFYDHSGERMNA
jgi:sarcosine oxidase subunit alpha